jgi:hypothetical protein
MPSQEIADLTDSLQPSNPFRSRVREVIDQKFPLISEGGSEVKRRNYDPKAEILDMIVLTKFHQAREEAKILGEMPRAIRFISVLEVSVAATLLAGESYGSQPMDDWVGTLSLHVGNFAIKLYETIKDGWKHEVDSQLGRICTLIVTGKMGFISPESALGKMGIKSFETEKINKKADEIIVEKEKNGALPQGSAEWLSEFKQFLGAVTETPFEVVMKNYGCFDDPNSKEGKQRIREILKAKKVTGTPDPRIEAIARTLEIKG